MKKARNGYTLIEIIMVILILVIIMAVIGITLNAGSRSYITSQPIVDMSSKAVFAIENISREIQSAQSLTTITSNSVTFTNQANQSVTINTSGTSLNRNGFLMAANISNLTFTYYDSNLTVTGTAANVRYITIQITMQSTQGAQTFSYTLLTGVDLRKLL